MDNRFEIISSEHVGDAAGSGIYLVVLRDKQTGALSAQLIRLMLIKTADRHLMIFFMSPPTISFLLMLTVNESMHSGKKLN